MPELSIIISTRNRADSLRLTLEAFGRVTVPNGWIVELLLVDNGSTDHTHAVANEVRLNTIVLRYLNEPKTGLSNARNAGLAAANGEVLLFTDDDVVPAADWLERMATPLLEKRCDAVVGRIELAEHLRRSWMKPVHKVWLAAPGADSGGGPELIGANMGFRRCVLERVPAFDPDMGPGTLGFADDTLFSWQLVEAGYRIQKASDAEVVHHFEPSRLIRSQWLAAARKRGATQAYILHHWQHVELRLPSVRYYYLLAKLWLRRILQPPPSLDKEGCPPWEMSYLAEMALCRQFMEERKRPRKYPRHGLQKKI